MNKIELDTKILLEMLEIRRQDYEEALYITSEQWEDRYNYSGLYQHDLFRGWWKMHAFKINSLMLTCLNIGVDSKISLHYKKGTNNYFIYGKEKIRQHYFRILQKRLMRVVPNPAAMQLIPTSKRMAS